MPNAFERLSDAIRRREATVAVVGLGYVGLPLCVALAERGFRVIGIDRDAVRLRRLRRGISYIPDVSAQAVRALCRRPRVMFASQGRWIRRAQVVLICVPTPLLKTREPDLSFIVAAVREVAKHLTPPALVVLESTTYPGTTDGIVRAEFEAAGHRMDRDVFLAFSPERVDPGNRAFSTMNIPRIIGGVTPRATRLATHVYSQIVHKAIPVSSSRVAETAKLLENTFRLINIALANEFALLCRALGIDVWEVIEAAKTKPFGFMPFFPGPGIGGHCIPTDPVYLSWRARAAGFEARLIDLASSINMQMPRYVVERVTELLNSARQRALHGARILVLGVAYKRDTNDTRESPALEIITLLAARGARVSYHDPWVPAVTVGRTRYRSKPLTIHAVRAADCVVIITEHQAVDYAWLGRHAPLIFDTRNIMRRTRGVRATVERL